MRRHIKPPRCDGYWSEEEGVTVITSTCSSPESCALHPEHSAANDKPGG